MGDVDADDKPLGPEASARLAQRLRAIIDGMFAFVGVFSLEGVLLEANRPPIEMAGLRREDVLGRLFWEADWWSHSAQTQDQVRQALLAAAQGETVREDFLVRLDGTFITLDTMFGPLRDASGRITGTMGSGVDVTEPRRLAARMAEAQALAHLGSWELDLATQRLWWSDEEYRNNGVEIGTPIEQQLFLSLVHPEDRDAFAEGFAAALSEGRGIANFRIVRPDGAIRHLAGTVSVTYDAAGEPVSMSGTNLDVTRERQAEAKLRESEERLRLAVDAAGLGTWELDATSGRACYSPESARMLGFTADELPGDDRAGFEARCHPDDRRGVVVAFEAYLGGETASFDAEYRMRTKDGAWKWIFSAGKIIERDPSDLPLRMIGVQQDIDKRKRSELATGAALLENQVLLREVHHRVKNNLQIVSSLLHFQAKKLNGAAAAVAFEEVRERLRSMVLVHEQLYRSEDLARIDLGGYVKALAAGIADSSGSTSATLLVEVGATSAPPLPVELVLPLGMLLTELVTNAFKHAFGEGPGTVRIEVAQVADMLVVSVHDDGVGMSADWLSTEPSTFGLQLVRHLAEQLDAIIEMGPGPGTRIIVRTPLHQHAQVGTP